MTGYTPSEVAAMQQAEADAYLLTAQSLAVGGDVWTVTRSTGNGIDEDVTEQMHTVQPAYVFQTKRRVATPDGATFVTVDEWRVNAPAETDLAEGDTLMSVATPTLQFQLMTLDTPTGYIAGTLERIV